MTKKLKQAKFLTYEQLVDNLKQKNLTISDRALAIELIKARGYYNLVNRYKNHVYNYDKHYPNYTHLTDLFLFQAMEADLQDILFQATINFEHRFKEAVAHDLATQIGIGEADYLDPLKYKRRKFNKAISITAFLLGIAYHTDKYPTKYYRDNYDCIPPWILLNNVTLGQVRMWFSIFNSHMTANIISEMLPIETDPVYGRIGKSGIGTLALRQMRSKEYRDIFGVFHEQSDEEIKRLNEEYQNNFNDIINLFKNMLSIIHDFRNNLAHGAGLFDFKAGSSLLLSPLRLIVPSTVVTNQEFTHQFGRNDLFSFMISLIVTLDKYDSVGLLKHLKDWRNNNNSTPSRANALQLFLKGLNLPSDFIGRLEHVKTEMTWEEYRHRML
ncbi:Abi family protein [Limosilactobacillus pontis]|uniref:Abi family protein n=1 Tax=Limosilactobacillus pontis TaxID=35787 RepID=UPI002F261CAF